MDLSPFISVFCEASQKPVSVHNNTQEQDSKRVSGCFNVVQLVWLNEFVCLFVFACLLHCPQRHHLALDSGFTTADTCHHCQPYEMV